MDLLAVRPSLLAHRGAICDDGNRRQLAQGLGRISVGSLVSTTYDRSFVGNSDKNWSWTCIFCLLFELCLIFDLTVSFMLRECQLLQPSDPEIELGKVMTSTERKKARALPFFVALRKGQIDVRARQIR